MKPAEDWSWVHTCLCANDPVVSGQLLPQVKMVEFIKQIQKDATQHAVQIVHDISRGTQSEDRITALDEAEIALSEIANQL